MKKAGIAFGGPPKKNTNMAVVGVIEDIVWLLKQRDDEKE